MGSTFEKETVMVTKQSRQQVQSQTVDMLLEIFVLTPDLNSYLIYIVTAYLQPDVEKWKFYKPHWTFS